MDRHHKGTESPSVRSRLVAKDFKQGGPIRHDLFAATPPLEAMKLMLSYLADASDRKDGGEECMLYVDVNRAYFYAAAQED
eukprot:7686490-Karenia_brevis.AAC.1